LQGSTQFISQLSNQTTKRSIDFVQSDFDVSAQNSQNSFSSLSVLPKRNFLCIPKKKFPTFQHQISFIQKKKKENKPIAHNLCAKMHWPKSKQQKSETNTHSNKKKTQIRIC